MTDECPAWATRIRGERKARRWSAAEMARRLRDAADERTRSQLPRVDVLVSYVRRWERAAAGITEQYRLLYAAAFGVGEEDLFSDSAPVLKPMNPDPYHDELRQGLQRALSTGAMAEATLDDWEQTVLRYGNAARSRPAAVVLGDLAIDLEELRRAMDSHRSASALRRLARVSAQMSGLMCLALIKLDARVEFRRWARTARIAASEAGDSGTQSWVLAQEAYGHYYAGDFAEAVSVAQGAQATGPCVGAALAAALEARAHAALGPDRAPQTRAALMHAENTLGGLAAVEVNTSAFGYNEAQLRFHEGSALTHLGDTVAAWKAQQRALELCPPADYMDRALTRLDRTICLVREGDVSGALEYAIASLEPLTDNQREGIITLHGQDVLEKLSSRQRALPAAQQLRELLTPISSTGRVERT